jgi:hypothetical protein
MEEIEIDLGTLAGLSLCDVIVDLKEHSISHKSIIFNEDQVKTLLKMTLTCGDLQKGNSASVDGCCFSYHIYRICYYKYKICYHEKENHKH